MFKIMLLWIWMLSKCYQEKLKKKFKIAIFIYFFRLSKKIVSQFSAFPIRWKSFYLVFHLKKQCGPGSIFVDEWRLESEDSTTHKPIMDRYIKLANSFMGIKFFFLITSWSSQFFNKNNIVQSHSELFFFLNQQGDFLWSHEANI